MKRYRHEAPAQPIPRHTLNPLALRLQAAAAIGIALWTVVFLVGLIIASLKHNTPTWEDARVSALLAGIVSIAVTCLLIIYWSFQTIERDRIIEDKDRQRQQELEDEAREFTLDQATEDQNRIHDTTVNLDRIPIVAWSMLSRYVSKEKTTRAAMTDSKCCTQAEWNEVNKALVDLGIKTRHKWIAGPDMMRLWHEWTTRAVIDDGRIWILDEAEHSPTPLS